MKRLITCLLLIHGLYVCYGQTKLSYLAEGFEDNRNNWIEETNKDYSFKVEDGHMVIHAYTSAVHAFNNVGATKDDSFGLHARMIFFNGSSEGWMGIRFGTSEDSKKYITFCYNNAQGFLVSMTNGKKYEVLRESKSTVVKPYDYNTLTVTKSGTSYKFLINDKQVFQDEINSFFGPLVGMYASQNMSIRVDEIQVFDPRKGKQKMVTNQATMAKATEEDVKKIILTESLPPDFQEFYNSFEKYAFPYDFSTVINRAKMINNLPFVQKNFYEYDLSTTKDHNVWAVAILSVCQNGYTFLVGNQYTTGIQKNFNFSIEAYDNKGNRLGRKTVGSIVEENDKYYQTLHFRVQQKGASITFDVEETYFNGNVRKSLVSFNGDLCNLNSVY